MSFYRPGGSGSGSVTSSPVSVAEGGTGASTAADARNNLGVTATGADTNYAFRANNLSDLNSASTARTNLGLGTIATQNANAVNITGGTIVSIVDLAVADGGTGASTATGALANLLPSYTSNANKVLSVKSDATGVEWTTNGSGTVTSVDISVPTGLSVSGNPITSSGTLAVSFASGYSIPTTAKQGEWDTAYGWGDHSTQGYAKYAATTANFTGTLQQNGSNVLTASNIGSTVQAYDADTAKYDDATANFTGTLQNNSHTVLTTATDYLDSADIGSTVQAYDADTAKYDDATANFTGTLQKSGSNVLVASDIGTSVQGYDADTTKNDVANTFTTNQIISTSSTDAALRITQTGAGNALLVEDSTNPDATPFVVDASGFVIQGYTANITSAAFQSNSGSPFSGIRWNAAATGPTLTLGKSRSATIGTNSIVSSGDTIGSISFNGDDGAAFISAASILSAIDGTPGTNDMPGRLVFSTTADGASSPTERMRITNTGRVGIGKTSPSTTLDVNGTVTATAFEGTISGGTYA